MKSKDERKTRKIIDKWKKSFLLDDWTITIESIDPKAVMYDLECPAQDRYYVGIQPDHKTKTATIYHDRSLTERDIIHELLHVKYPEWSEARVNEAEELLYNTHKLDVR